MADNDVKIKDNIEKAIKAFSETDFLSQAVTLFSTLGYNTGLRSPLAYKTYHSFKETYETSINEENALVDDWKSVDLLFQITKEMLHFDDQVSLFPSDSKVNLTIIESYLFFAIELKKDEYSRTALAKITREINKVFSMPAMLIFKYGGRLTISAINRRLHRTKPEKDVLEKVTLIKDISIYNPHRAHTDILYDLSYERLLQKHKFTGFVELHNAWQKTLDTKELNNRFYKELSNWYFWAMKEVRFPDGSTEKHSESASQEEKAREHTAKSLIRLLTRILFVWFCKEKKLVPDELFNDNYINDSLKDGFEPRKNKDVDQKMPGDKYYKAILQNLFFATLNQTVGDRTFRKPGQNMNVTNLMRYENCFKDPKAFIQLVDEGIPFINGGLFECLDKPDPQKKGTHGGDFIIYEDGFSDRDDNVLMVPDYIFFGTQQRVDLSDELGDKKNKNIEIKGLINILKSYKFTITENTPIEEDIALDPELLGRVFENLLASYNPETKTTARKQTGSFYTPREIVNYMVDESLRAYLQQKLETVAKMKPADAEVGLDFLISYNEKEHLFDDDQTDVLINAIDNIKILDPACGSGAFPMGMLHKLVYLLGKLDPDNSKWRELQKQKAIEETKEAYNIGDKEEREKRLVSISEVFENNSSDYGRKLYLIEDSIYGVDIHPIAIQISKLRFFISLIVDQNVDKTKDNFSIIPLPNLETNFIAADTLIDIEKDKKLFDYHRDINALEKELKKVRHSLFRAKKPKDKRTLRDEDKAIREKMSDLLIIDGWEKETARQLAKWDPYDHNAISPSFNAEWMLGVRGGFDVVIANPPYVNIFNINDKDYRKILTTGFTVAKNKTDLYAFFIEKGISLLKKCGTLYFIVSNSWLGTDSFSRLREFLLNETKVSKLVKCPANTFDATVTALILGTKKQKVKDADIELYELNNNAFTKLPCSLSYDMIRNQVAFGFTFKQPISVKIPHIMLGDIALFSLGIKTSNDAEFILDYKKDNHSYRLLRGKDINKYAITYKDKWIWYKPQLMKQKKGAGPRKLDYFIKSPKILIQDVAIEIRAALDTNNYLTTDTLTIIYNIEGYEFKFVLALLNSKFINTWFKTNFDSGLHIKINQLQTIPLPANSLKQQQPIISIVDQILTLKQKDPKADTTALEREIDLLVYKFYELTPEEVAIVEGKG